MLRQRQGALGLRSPRLVVASAGLVLAAPDLQAQAQQAAQRHDRPVVGVADPHRAPAVRAELLQRAQALLVRRLHPAPTPGHLQTLNQLRLTASTGSRFCSASSLSDLTKNGSET